LGVGFAVKTHPVLQKPPFFKTYVFKIFQKIVFPLLLEPPPPPPPLNKKASSPRPGSSLPHLRRDLAQPRHICAGTWLTAATSAPGPGSPPRHVRRDLPHPYNNSFANRCCIHILHSHLPRDWAHRCHICAAKIGSLPSATCVPGLGSPLPICACCGLRSPLRHLRWD
jgi:hypothetical protein